MNRWERYPAYKDSGIEWIGEIPAHWEVKPGFVVYKEKNFKNEGLKENQLLSLSYGRLIKKQISEQTGLVPESYETYQIVEPGNIIIRCTDLQNDKTSLRTAISEYRGIITSAYLNLEIKYTGAFPKFIHYFLHTLDTTKVLYKFGKGLRQNLSFEDFKRLPIVLPPLPEQKAIAEFLDKKTEQIDRAIAAKERLISLLKERRQILIHRAVTRGLDQGVPTKDSGIEWIGEIPEHWEIKKIKHVAVNLNYNVPTKKDQISNISYVK